MYLASRSRPLRASLLGVAALVSFTPVGRAQQDWYVDVNAPGCEVSVGTKLDPFCNIMDAVNTASDGDTIYIAPGTYFENVLLDKDLELIGTRGQAVTILDGMASGSVIRVRDSAVTLTGLTLTNGTGTLYGYGESGGGLFVYSPQDLNLPVTLSDCRVTGNYAEYGGGISNGDRGLPQHGQPLTLVRTTVNENYRDGIYSRDTLTVLDSTIERNTSTGIRATAPLTLTNTTVSGNGAEFGGFGVFCHEARLTGTNVSGNGSGLGSSGVVSFGGPLSLRDCNITRNIGYTFFYPDGGGSSGGGVVVLRPSGPVTLVNTTVSYNGTPGEYADAFGIYVVVPSGDSSNVSLTLTNSTLANNAWGGISGYIFSGASVELNVRNSILSNPGGYFEIRPGEFSTVSVTHSLLMGGWPGTGNIDADPLFVNPMNGDYSLLPVSPCIDAGNNTAVPSGVMHDLRGMPRFLDDPRTPDTGVGPAPVVDMGAYEFSRRLRRTHMPVPYVPPRIIR